MQKKVEKLKEENKISENKFWERIKSWFFSKEEEETDISDIKDDIRFIAIFLVIFSLFRFFIFDYYIIPSSSMVPTLLIGDMPLV